MRISCDLDGVVADMDSALAALGADLFAPSAGEPAGPRSWTELSVRRQTRLWQRVRKACNFWESLRECEPGEVRRLQQLTQQQRWEVIFLTQRPETDGRTAQQQSQRWLRQHGFELPSVFTTQGTRGRIAAALTIEAHIDDRLEHCLEVASESKAWPLLVWRDAESFASVAAQGRKEGFAVVRTLAEALTRLAEVG
jgi:hypothetical protein